MCPAANTENVAEILMLFSCAFVSILATNHSNF